MSIIRDTIDCGTWRERRPSANKLWLKNRPSIDCESIAGGWGRARGLTGGAFTGVMLAHQSKTYTARDYVQSGLVGLWDGIENAGYGVHDPSSASWVDLSGNGHDWVGIMVSGMSWGVDHLSVYARSGIILQDWSLSGCKTVEVCGWSEQTNSYVLFGLGSNYRIFCILPTNNRGFQFAHNAPSMFQPHNTDWTASATWGSANNPDHTYYNGQEREHNAGTSSWGVENKAQFFYKKTSYLFRGKVRCIRVYDRALTAEEVAANYAIDKARFNLP